MLRRYSGGASNDPSQVARPTGISWNSLTRRALRAVSQRDLFSWNRLGELYLQLDHHERRERPRSRPAKALHAELSYVCS